MNRYRCLNSAGAVLALLLTTAASAVPIPTPPTIDAKAYILTDFASGRVLAEQNADQRLEPASLTKIMTAYAVFKALKEHRLKLGDMVTISEHAWRAEGSRTFVQVGTQVPAEVLIEGMIVQSGNDASIALAEKVGGTEDGFVQLMNEYARQLGLKATHFQDSSGLPDPQHYTSARDMALLARALVRDFPEYYRYYSMKEFVWNNIKQQNRNGLLSTDPSVDGIKTGHTDSAGYCLVTSANRNGMRLISVVLGTPSIKAREAASATLLNYGYTFYETVKVRGRGETVLKPRVYKGAEPAVALGTLQDVFVTVPRGDAAGLTTGAHANEPLVAPIATVAPLGELTVNSNAQVVARVPLYALKGVAPGGWWTRLTDSMSLWWH
jgi:serine-type D-Ala-D-Ala carboxypeptidase (penicillin-binding protein 5/6)